MNDPLQDEYDHKDSDFGPFEPTPTMTAEQKCIAIAKACGWVECGSDSERMWYLSPKLSELLRANAWKLIKELRQQIPDYLTDLNAMHEAEELLSDKQWLDYMMNLYAVCTKASKPTTYLYHQPSTTRLLTHATATQRAEAFGLTLNLWPPS